MVQRIELDLDQPSSPGAVVEVIAPSFAVDKISRCIDSPASLINIACQWWQLRLKWLGIVRGPYHTSVMSQIGRLLTAIGFLQNVASEDQAFGADYRAMIAN